MWIDVPHSPYTHAHVILFRRLHFFERTTSEWANHRGDPSNDLASKFSLYDKVSPFNKILRMVTT